MTHLELGFIGFGLIGGSIARSLKKKGLDIRVSVYTRRKNPQLEQGVCDGVIDELLYEVDNRLARCDIIFLCAPVLKNIEYLPILKPIISSSCIVTDVGSAKGKICLAARENGLQRQFIGGHPMAGAEKTGYENSTSELLRDSYYILTPDECNSSEDIETLSQLIRDTGARCITMSTEEHDRITAGISHVPHIVAASLVNMVQENDDSEEKMKACAAGGFRDLTRIASSSPAMWQDICLANRESIDLYLRLLEEKLKTFRHKMAEGDLSGIYEEFCHAKEYRDSLPEQGFQKHQDNPWK